MTKTEAIMPVANPIKRIGKLFGSGTVELVAWKSNNAKMR